MKSNFKDEQADYLKLKIGTFKVFFALTSMHVYTYTLVMKAISIWMMIQIG